MHEKNSQFILLKIPPNLLGLLGKIHALSIEVLYVFKYTIKIYLYKKVEKKNKKK